MQPNESHQMPEDLRIPGIGEGLRILREQRGLSLADLAEKLDCDRSRLSKYENGHNAISVAFLESVAQALGESPEAVVLFCLNQRYDLQGTSAWKMMQELCTRVRGVMDKPSR